MARTAPGVVVAKAVMKIPFVDLQESAGAAAICRCALHHVCSSQRQALDNVAVYAVCACRAAQQCCSLHKDTGVCLMCLQGFMWEVTGLPRYVNEDVLPLLVGS